MLFSLSRAVKWIAVIHDLAVKQTDDACGILRSQIRIMRDHDDQPVFRDLLEQVHDLHAGGAVQRAGRFIRKQDLRIIHQRTGNGYTLHLPAAHLVGLFVDLIFQSHLFQRLDGTAAALFPGYAGKRQGQLHIGQHILMRDQIVALEDETDGMVAVIIPVFIFEIFGGSAIDDQITAGILIQPADDVEQGRLAASALSQDGDKFTFAK